MYNHYGGSCDSDVYLISKLFVDFRATHEPCIRHKYTIRPNVLYDQMYYTTKCTIRPNVPYDQIPCIIYTTRLGPFDKCRFLRQNVVVTKEFEALHEEVNKGRPRYLQVIHGGVLFHNKHTIIFGELDPYKAFERDPMTKLKVSLVFDEFIFIKCT